MQGPEGQWQQLLRTVGDMDAWRPPVVIMANWSHLVREVGHGRRAGMAACAAVGWVSCNAYKVVKLKHPGPDALAQAAGINSVHQPCCLPAACIGKLSCWA